MALFALSDTHLSIKVNKPMDVFGFRWDRHQERIRDNWTEAVTVNDTVVIPGDISWGIDFDEAEYDLRFLNELPGKKIIMKGNHDYWWNTVSKMNKFFEGKNFDTISILNNNAIEAGGRIICGTRGWYPDDKSPADSDFEKIVKREAGRLKKYGEDKQPIVFTHFPIVFGDYICAPLMDVLHEYGVTDCFYGHIHGVYDIPPTFCFDNIRFTIVSADYLNFKPLLICD